MRLHGQICFVVGDIRAWPLSMDAFILYQFIISMNGELRQSAQDIQEQGRDPDMTDEESTYWESTHKLLLQAGSYTNRGWCWLPISNKDITDSIGFKTGKVTRLIAELVQHELIRTKRTGLPPTRWIKIRSLNGGGE